MSYDRDTEPHPDGSNPYLIQQAWRPWIISCVDRMDGKGTQRSLARAGAYNDQPAIELQIDRIIRGRWVELVNEMQEAAMKGR